MSLCVRVLFMVTVSQTPDAGFLPGRFPHTHCLTAATTLGPWAHLLDGRRPVEIQQALGACSSAVLVPLTAGS